MGEVLENGVYLPDEGERNAYNGLKGNWNTVDTVVAQVQALSSTGLIRKPVDELPTEDIETNVIYMLKATKPNGDVYRIEYMYIDGHWDALGTSETTLDDYYTKTETDDLPAVKSGINATRVSNYDAHLANNDIHVTLANKQSWDGKQNALDTAQTAAVNSGITGVKVTGYDSHVSDTDIHVTTSDKAAWNGKQDGLSQTQLAAVNSGITEAKRTGYDNHVADTDVHVTTADKAAWNGKQNALTQTQLDNIAAVPDKANSADLATVATTGDYGDLLNAPTIPTVNNASLTIQKNGADVATFTANASSNVTANLAIPVNTSDLNNDAGFLTQHNPVDAELSATSENALQNKVINTALNGKAPLVHAHAASDVTSGTFNIARIPNLDASKITSGTIDIARLPKGALERLVKVANQAARYALTTDDVQLGDTVQQLDTGVMYVVTDETKLDSADGYTEFTAGAASSVPWTGVTGKPNDYPPSSHTHTKSQITDFPALATVATSGSYNDLNNIPASFTPSSHTHGNITNDGKVGTAANKPLITGTDGVVQAGAFGNAANTFCEGNDSRLSDARTPVAHTHTKSDVTDLLNSNFIPSANNSYDLGSSEYNWNNVYCSSLYSPVVTNSNNAESPSDSSVSSVVALRNVITYTSGDPTIAARLNLRLMGTGEKSLYPHESNQYSFGLASRAWSNSYIQHGYFTGIQQNDEYSNNTRTNLTLTANKDSPGVSGILVDTFRSNTTQGQAHHILGFEMKENSTRYAGCRMHWSYDSSTDKYNFALCPTKQGTNQPASFGLGETGYYWDTINGINPGALSLPNFNYSDSNKWIDISGNITDETGGGNEYDPTVDGWVVIYAENNPTSLRVNVHAPRPSIKKYLASATGVTIDGMMIVSVPAPAGSRVYIYFNKGSGSLGAATFITCLGNV